MEIISAASSVITQAIAILRDGGVVVHATETCYGLACDIGNPEAVEKLFVIKKRPHDLPVSALFASIDQAKEYVEWNDAAEELSSQLPGPLTIILPIAPDKAGSIFPCPSPCPNLGIRISPHPLAQELVETFGSPITTTSANVSGQPSTYSAEEIVEQFRAQEHQPDLLIDGGKLPQNAPSTVIDVASGVRNTLR